MDYSVKTVVPAVVKVVNVISDIGHGGMKVARRVQESATPVVLEAASKWRQTVDTHIAPNVEKGINFVGQKAVEGMMSQ